jgi:hypothetical protein
MSRFVVLAAFSLGFATTASAQASRPTPCSFQSDRLRIDSIPGVGQVMFAGGAVTIRCPARGITLKGDSAERYAEHDQMVGHAVYDEPRFHVTADFLNYFPNDERVVAAGNVNARLPSGSTLVGPQAEYRRPVPRIRPRQQMSAIGHPTITIVEKDSSGKPTPPTTVVANNVFMDGDSLVYAWGQVVITRPEIQANADSAFIDEGKETMRLMRSPILRGKREKPFTLSGDLIDLFSNNRKLSRVLARAHAKAVSDSMTLTSDTLDLRVRNDLLDHAYAWGPSRARVVSPSQNVVADSLDVFMPGQKIQLVRAVRQALAQGRPDTTKFHVEAPDTTDWVLGDTVIARFDTLATRDTSKTPPIRTLIASGHASSLYHLAPNDTAERRPAINHVTARIITINFDQQKVATVTTVDSVAGIYIEPKPDSTTKRRNANGGAKGALNGSPSQNPPGTKPPSSVVPLPAKPPTKPPTRP